MILIMKGICTVAIQHTRWEPTMLYNNTNNHQAHACTLSHTHTHTRLGMSGRYRLNIGYTAAATVRLGHVTNRLSVQYGPQLIQSSRTVKLTVSFWNYISYQKYSNLMRKSDLEADRNGIVTGGPRADIKLNRLPPQKLQKSCSSCRN